MVTKQDYDEKDEKGRQQDEKDEKGRQQDEKELQKQEEKSAEEKWQRDRLGALVWASILIWAGVVLLASNLGAFDLLSDIVDSLPFWQPFNIEVVTVEAWTVFWLGAALILLFEAVVRLLVPAYRRSITGTLIVAVVFIGLGLGNWNCVWPLVLIAIGVSILLRNVSGSSKGE
jgi:hypothetical protein